MQLLDIETDILQRRRRTATVTEFEIFNKAVGDFIFDGRNKVTLMLEAALAAFPTSPRYRTEAYFIIQIKRHRDPFSGNRVKFLFGGNV